MTGPAPSSVGAGEPAAGPRLEALRRLLCDLGDEIRTRVVAHRDRSGIDAMAEVVDRVEADVVYAIDRVGEDQVLEFLHRRWPVDQPVRLVMEGIDDHVDTVVPPAAAAADVQWILVVDPIDGTRNLMFDKRSAWVLAGLAPARLDVAGRPVADLPDIVVAAMTEIPTTKQWRADQLSAVRGCGPAGIHAEGIDVRTGDRQHLAPSPSRARTLDHGFASFSHYLPDGKAWLAALEQVVLDELVPADAEPRQVFEDQYICSAGQIHEVLTGRDRLVGDLRPFALEALGRPVTLVGHPYDLCTVLVFTEAGGVFEHPLGGPLVVPIDTTSPCSWVAYANEHLAALVRPVLARHLRAAMARPGAGPAVDPAES